MLFFPYVRWIKCDLLFVVCKEHVLLLVVVCYVDKLLLICCLFVRWIKFEEDVEGRGWGRPHVSALTFHSLSALRKTLESGEYGHVHLVPFPL